MAVQLHEDLYVSRETEERLIAFSELLKKWNAHINIVSKTTIDDIWQRHIIDSAAAFPLVSKHEGRWLDLGSGGGLPAIVLAVLAADAGLDQSLTCVEADLRKCEFMRTAARKLDIPLQVATRRIEQMPPQNAQAITSRALAPLSKMLGYLETHIGADGAAYLHKGARWKEEVAEARAQWHFVEHAHPSWTSDEAAILEIREVKRV